MDVATIKSSSADGFHASQSSGCFHSDSGYQRKEQLQDVCNKGSPTVDMNEENQKTWKDNCERLKDEAVNVLSAEIIESTKAGSKTTSSNFGSGATNISIHMVDRDYTESSQRFPDALVLETKGLATLELDTKPCIPSALQDASTGYLKSSNYTEHISCKENPTGGTVSGSETRQFSMEVEHKKPCAYSEEIHTGWQNGVTVIGMATSSGSSCHEVDDDQNISDLDKCTEKTDEFPSFDLGF